MAESVLTMARRHVLGDLNFRCEPIQNVPVYMDDTASELLGFADESFGKYADALTFHLADVVCKKLASGQFTYSFEFDFADETETTMAASKRRIKLSSITLMPRKGYEKPIPRRSGAAKVDSTEAVS